MDYLHGFDNNNSTGLSFSNAITLQSSNNGTGLLNIPEGTSDFEVTVPIVDDTLAEEKETVILGISQEGTIDNDQSFIEAIGQIFDNDSPTPDLQVESIIASSVQEGDGRDLEYTITFNQATADKTTLNFSVSEGSEEVVAIGGADPEDGKTDYLNGEAVTFTALGSDEASPLTNDSFVLEPNDKALTIPAGIRSFKASVPVVDDSRVENTETATLLIGDETGIGQIFDNDEPEEDPVVVAVSGDSVVEGGENPLKFTIELSKPTNEETTFTYQLGGDAAGSESFIPGEVDYLTGEGNTDFDPEQIVIKEGVVGDQQDNVVVVPEGVQSFSVTAPVPDDNIPEPTKIVELKVGGQRGQAKIFDNDAIIDKATPVAIKSITANSVQEGDGEPKILPRIKQAHKTNYFITSKFSSAEMKV